jgi:hypothetical protein
MQGPVRMALRPAVARAAGVVVRGPKALLEEGRVPRGLDLGGDLRHLAVRLSRGVGARHDRSVLTLVTQNRLDRGPWARFTIGRL